MSSKCILIQECFGIFARKQDNNIFFLQNVLMILIRNLFLLLNIKKNTFLNNVGNQIVDIAIDFHNIEENTM